MHEVRYMSQDEPVAMRTWCMGGQELCVRLFACNALPRCMPSRCACAMHAMQVCVCYEANARNANAVRAPQGV